MTLPNTLLEMEIVMLNTILLCAIGMEGTVVKVIEMPTNDLNITQTNKKKINKKYKIKITHFKFFGLIFG